MSQHLSITAEATDVFHPNLPTITCSIVYHHRVWQHKREQDDTGPQVVVSNYSHTPMDTNF
jgi:hypothetical protein